MSRTIHADLTTAQAGPLISPLARIIARRNRLALSLKTQGTNPWGYTDDSQTQEGENYVYGAVAKNDLGTKILRIWQGTGNLYMQTVATPATNSQWSHATNPWVDLGIAPDDYTGVSIGVGPSLTRIFYISGNTIRHLSSTNGAVSFGASALISNGPGNGWVAKSVAAVWGLEVIVLFYNPSGNTVQLVRYYYDNLTWNADTLTDRWNGYTDVALGASTWSTYTYLSAAKLGTVTHIAFCLGSAGKTWTMSNRNNSWSNPHLALPDDYSGFCGYRMVGIGEKLYLTGRVTRSNIDNYSPVMDVYLTSIDGENWTHLSRDSYICVPEIRGTFVLFGGILYYVGLYSVYSATAPYSVDPDTDNASLKLEISGEGGSAYKDLLGASLQFPSAGTAPQLTAEINNADDGYYTGAKANIVKPGSELWFDLGLKTVSGNKYAAMLHGLIDQMPLAMADGVRAAQVVARCSASARLIDWVSPFYAELLSQIKHVDDCSLMDQLYIANGGIYQASSDNLLPNGDFEEDAGWWNEYYSGSAAGANSRIDDESQSGGWSYKIRKTSGPTADSWGSLSAFAAQGGQTYTVTVYLKVASISGGAEQVRIFVGGDWGLGASQQSVTVDVNGVTDVFESHELSFTTVVASVITVRVEIYNADTATVYIDNVTAKQESLGFIQFKSSNKDGVLFSTTPLDADACDVRVRAQQVVPRSNLDLLTGEGSLEPVPGGNSRYDANDNSSAVARFGPIVCGVDQYNFVTLYIDRPANTLYLGRMVAGALQVLTSLVAPLGIDTLSYNQSYDLRLVHRGGQFYGYLKEAEVTSWGAPKVTYTWAKDTPPINNATGRGKVGVYTYYRPMSFRAVGIDADSCQIAIRDSDSLDWSQFPASGQVMWDDEIIDYERKTDGVTVVTPASYFGAAVTRRDQPYTTAPAPPATNQSWYYNYGSPRLGWDNFTQLVLSSAGDYQRSYLGWAIVFVRGLRPYASWEIIHTLWDAYPGHAGSWGEGKDPWGYYGFETDSLNSGHGTLFDQEGNVGSSSSSVKLCPALLSCTRGVANTVAVSHTEDSLVKMYHNDYLIIEEVQVYDYERDYCTEDLLARISGMAGVFSPDFDNFYPTGVELDAFSPHSGAYGGADLVFDDPTWLGSIDSADADLRFVFTAPNWATGTNTSIAVWLRATNQFLASLTGLVVEIRTTGSLRQINLWNWVPTAAAIVESFEMIDPPTAATTVECRVVVTGEFITVYLNDAIQATFHTTLYSAQAHNNIGLGCRESAVAYSSVRIPELHEFREAFYVDNDETGMSAIHRVIEDRPIKMASRSGETVKFSTFDQRDTLTTMTTLQVQDTRLDGENDVFSYLRVYAAEIMEVLDADLAAERGFIMRTVQMSRASVAVAGAMITRLFRQVRELLVGRQISAYPQLNWEVEDKLRMHYLVSGTLLEVDETMIINDVTYTLDAGENDLSLMMNVTARKWVS